MTKNLYIPRINKKQKGITRGNMMIETMKNFDGQYATLDKKLYTLIEVEEKSFFVDSKFENVYKVMGQNSSLKRNLTTIPVAKVIKEETITRVLSCARMENNNNVTPKDNSILPPYKNNKGLDGKLLDQFDCF